jgi:hypothetical protein
MRFLASDMLTGACFAALIVLAAGQAPKMEIGSASSATAPAREIIDHSRLHGYAPDERTFDGSSSGPGRESVRAAATATETASTTPADGLQKPESLLGRASAIQPAIDMAARKLSGGLGAAADGGVDAHVPPIVRQRPKTPPLAGEPKPKAKVKSADTKKSSSKQAQGAVTSASVKR